MAQFALIGEGGPSSKVLYMVQKAAWKAGDVAAWEPKRVGRTPSFLAALLGTPAVLFGKGSSFGTLAEVIRNG
jgi:hypothetical protein